MTKPLQLQHPWLIAVWPGMGQVAIGAGYYLLTKLDMNLIAEFEAGELFDIDHVEVKNGLIQTGRRPRNRFFLWKDPNEKHDLVLFVGEAQPPLGKYMFCRKLIDYAKELQIERIITFAAMATQMRPEQRSRVFAAATHADYLGEVRQLELEIIEDGHIGGLNGVLLGVAEEQGLHGLCLLGELPHIFSQLPYPKASFGILEVFTAIAGIELDFSELKEQANHMDQQLSELLAKMEESMGRPPGLEEESYLQESVAEEEKIPPAAKLKIESLFEEAAKDRKKAFELKRELDKLGVFKEYEDRFLDLFKKSEG